MSSRASEPHGVDPVVEAYKAGIDQTLLRRNLRRTPEERVLAAQELLKLAEEVRQAGAARRRADRRKPQTSD